MQSRIKYKNNNFYIQYRGIETFFMWDDWHPEAGSYYFNSHKKASKWLSKGLRRDKKLEWKLATK